MMKTIRSFFIAGVIPMLCNFSSTLIQFKIIFALGGMVNNTLVLNLSVVEKESRTRISSKNISDFKGSCISSDADIELYCINKFHRNLGGYDPIISYLHIQGVSVKVTFSPSMSQGLNLIKYW